MKPKKLLMKSRMKLIPILSAAVFATASAHAQSVCVDLSAPISTGLEYVYDVGGCSVTISSSDAAGVNMTAFPGHVDAPAIAFDAGETVTIDFSCAVTGVGLQIWDLDTSDGYQETLNIFGASSINLYGASTNIAPGQNSSVGVQSVMLDPDGSGSITLAAGAEGGVIGLGEICFDVVPGGNVPEPSGALLVGLTATLGLLRRRR